jgi:asparagine synthase (glutamine-hydrolysing)
MSGICGIVNFSGRPIGQEELKYMSDAASHRGQDGTTFWFEGSIGMAYLSLIITPESRGDKQPLVNGHMVLAADARVDNRDELMRILMLKSKNATDADLIMAAYCRWGVDCPKHIIGDFAFALWDNREKHLLLARDPMAMRSLYYQIETKRLLFATEIKQIIALPDISAEIYEPAIAAFLAGPAMPLQWTFYKGINQLEAGHTLVLKSRRTQIRRFWDINPQNRIYYKDKNEYIEQFRELFKESVKCRLRSIRPIGLMLSGGMDSMSIAATVGWLIQRQTTEAYPLFLSFSSYFNEWLECDERHISSLITNHFGFPTIDVPADQAWPLCGYPGCGPDQDEPYMGVYQPLIELHLHMARKRNVGRNDDRFAGRFIACSSGI